MLNIMVATGRGGVKDTKDLLQEIYPSKGRVIQNTVFIQKITEGEEGVKPLGLRTYSALFIFLPPYIYATDCKY